MGCPRTSVIGLTCHSCPCLYERFWPRTDKFWPLVCNTVDGYQCQIVTGFPLLFTVDLRSHVPSLWELAAKLLHISFGCWVWYLICPSSFSCPMFSSCSLSSFSDDPIRLRREVVLLTDDRNLRVKALTRHVPVRDIPAFLKWAKVGWSSHMSKGRNPCVQEKKSRISSVWPIGARGC